MPNWVSFGRNYPSVCLGVCRGCGRMLCCSQVRDIVRTYHQHVLAYISTLLLHMVLITDQTTFSKIYFFSLENSNFWHEFPTMQAKPISPSVICTHFWEKILNDCSRLLDVYLALRRDIGWVGTLAKSKVPSLALETSPLLELFHPRFFEISKISQLKHTIW